MPETLPISNLKLMLEDACDSLVQAEHKPSKLAKIFISEVSLIVNLVTSQAEYSGLENSPRKLDLVKDLDQLIDSLQLVQMDLEDQVLLSRFPVIKDTKTKR